MSVRVVTLSELLATPQPGDARGTCYVCGRDTSSGHRRPPSDNFTAWSLCTAGDVVCELCAPLFADRRFRSRSWLLTRAGVRFHEPGESRDWLREVVLDPPEPPFVLYLTRGGKKQGWLSLVHRVSFSRDTFWVGTDWLDWPVLMQRALAERWIPGIEKLLLEHDVPARAVARGTFGPAVWRRAVLGGWTGLLDWAMEQASDPRWEVCCDVARRPARHDRRTPGQDLFGGPVAEDQSQVAA